MHSTMVGKQRITECVNHLLWQWATYKVAHYPGSPPTVAFDLPVN
jgi:hypothetical protein